MNRGELQGAITAIVQQIVTLTKPERILLFGSAAKGQWQADSDLDFLVVVPDDAPEDVFRDGRLRQAVGGVGHAVDVIPWRRSDFEGRAAYVVASLPATVVREGRLLYDAERVAA